MSDRLATRSLVALPIAVCLAAIAFAIAAPPASGGDPRSSLYVAGHIMGLGEKQVYLIDRHSRLSLRYRDSSGRLRAKTFDYHAQTSVAWTIEGISPNGSAVLAVATAAANQSAAAPNGGQGSSMHPQPSPRLDARGEVGIGENSGLFEVAPLSVLLSGIEDEVLAIGKGWKSSGLLRLAYGTLSVDLDNVVTTTAGDQYTNVAQIGSNGRTGYFARVNVPGLGMSTLRGAGTASATSFLETQNKLPLGMRLDANSRGNLARGDRRGSYDLSVDATIKLVRYVPGTPPYSGSPGFVPASSYLGGLSTPDTQIYSSVPPNPIAIPAPTDTGYIGPPAYATPYQSAFPEMSLPPIPLPIPSDQPIASPPAGPSPTPRPTRY